MLNASRRRFPTRRVNFHRKMGPGLSSVLGFIHVSPGTEHEREVVPSGGRGIDAAASALVASINIRVFLPVPGGRGIPYPGNSAVPIVRVSLLPLPTEPDPLSPLGHGILLSG